MPGNRKEGFKGITELEAIHQQGLYRKRKRKWIIHRKIRIAEALTT
jgi:hypothetical protein